jgi:cytosine/adenosine deaminase-related metal-dependent hydrolase
LGTVLKGGTLVELEPAHVEVADLRVEEGRIVARGADLPAREGDDVVSLSGKLVMAGLVSAHVQPAAVLGRGLRLPSAEGRPLPPSLEARFRLEDALDLHAVQVAGTVTALEALQSGTTTVFAHHASPACPEGSLLRLARGVNEVGVRAVLAYAASDRAGEAARERGLAEAVAFTRKAQGRFRGAVGVQPLCTVTDAGLQAVARAVAAVGGALHAELAEVPQDERLCVEHHGRPPVERLLAANLLEPRALAAHVVHLAWADLAQLIATGTWLVHAPRANMQAEVGYAPAGKFGHRATLGTAELGADLFAEAQAARRRSLDAGQPVDVLRYLANGHRLASEAFGAPVGPLREGALADLLVLDYRPPTPLLAETLAAHLLDGLSSRSVESVMVDGVWRMWARKPLSVSPESITEEARSVAREVWARMGQG